ncbi:hypothetical protein ACFP56_19170 [Paenibacillus septentrionalis]|uniref:GNAT family N-acetyltransferase n=1 Tax=Paenibacillus septentrionalis TaxID=429342 RepID=A0ABW1V8G9_9BACL
MQVEIMRVSAFMYEQRYMEYVLDRYMQLEMPYPFSVSLGYLASPVLMNEEIFLALDDDHDIVGCLSLIRGTAEYNYENREVVQLQVVYIEPQYRASRLFLQLLQLMTQCLRYLEEPVAEIQFWTKADERLLALITKRIKVQPQLHQSVYGPLHSYVLPYEKLEKYVSAFPQVNYF